MKKTLICVDCRVEFTYEHLRGPTRQRCDTCRTQRKAATDSAKSRRYRDRDPERHKAQLRAGHARRKQHPDFRTKRNEYEMVRKYGLTMADFEVLLEQQGGVCAICAGGRRGSGKRFHVDHNHETGQVRGLLCGNCNTAIGLLGDDPERADKVAVYLRR